MEGVRSTAPTSGTDGRLSDAARLRRVRDTGMLDGATYPSLDRLARAAAHQLRAARAQVSLVTADRRVVAGRAGPPLAHSFCGLVVDAEAPLLICDGRIDERVGGHPAVADGVVAYAGFPVRSPDGYVLGAFCVIDERPREWEPRELLLVEDLTAAVQAEVELRAANQEAAATIRRLHGVLAETSDAYVSIDSYGTVTDWNTAAERLFGYPAAEAVGRAVADLILPERFRAAHAAGLARLHTGGPSTLAGQRVELCGRNRDGTEFPVEIMIQMVAADDGSPAYHAFLHDISDRVAGRARLEGERAFLQALLDSLAVGVAAHDAEGRLTLFNQAMRDLQAGDGGLDALSQALGGASVTAAPAAGGGATFTITLPA